jgi:hypothetical protein
MVNNTTKYIAELAAIPNIRLKTRAGEKFLSALQGGEEGAHAAGVGR